MHIVPAMSLAVRDALLARLELHVADGTFAFHGLAVWIEFVLFDLDMRGCGRMIEDCLELDGCESLLVEDRRVDGDFEDLDHGVD